MPDITMCKDEKCPRKKKCYRYMAKPSLMQSYVVDTFRTNPDELDECEYFWAMLDLTQKETK